MEVRNQRGIWNVGHKMGSGFKILYFGSGIFFGGEYLVKKCV